MKTAISAFGAVLIAGATAAAAAVSPAQFPPKTVRDLIDICAPAKDDPMMTAAINYCHGFAQGAVLVEEANEAHHGARQLFCLPEPRPATGSEIGKFFAWANARPARLDDPAIDGMFIYLAETYPCAHPAVAGQRRAR